MRYKKVKLREISQENCSWIRGPIEVVATPQFICDKSSFFHPIWQGVVGDSRNTLLVKDSGIYRRWGPRAADRIMLHYATNQEKEVTFRGKLDHLIAGSMAGPKTPILKVNGFMIGEYKTVNYYQEDMWKEYYREMAKE